MFLVRNILGGQTKELPFEVKEGFPAYDGKTLWKLNNAVKKLDRTGASVFSFDSKKNASKLATANNYYKRIRTVRHPNLLTYYDGLENEGVSLSIVTEEVVPLSESLEEARKYPSGIVWGLYQVTTALAFLNNDCNMIHGNVTIDNIFVNKSGDWKLGGFDLLSPVNDASSPLRAHNDIVANKYKSPEYQSNKWSAVEGSSNWAIDDWMLACVIYEIYNGSFNQIEDLKKTGDIPKELLPIYQQLLHSKAENRPNPKKILESPYFNNPFVETCLFLEQISLKDNADKEKFFKKLDSLIDSFPAACCKYKILPHLVTALDFGTANSKVLGPLLKIGKLLTPEEYASRITPSVVKWFASNDRAFRTNLLQNLEHFVDQLSPSLVDEQIFPNVATGFTDTSPALRELTLKSMLLLVPKMTDKTINTAMLKFFAKLQMDEEPGIRTNTTICLAKIATNLSHGTRQKILVPAFCRAMRDPFPRTRVAGVMSLIATQNYYMKDDIATKIIPSVSPLAIDPEKDVRDVSFQALTDFVQKLKKISETGVEENVETASESVQAGYLGWALGSLSKKIYGEQGQTPNSNASPNIQSPTTPTSTPKMSTPASESNSIRSSSGTVQNNHHNNVNTKSHNDNNNNNKNGWEDDFDLEEEEDDDYNSWNNNSKTTATSKRDSKNDWESSPSVPQKAATKSATPLRFSAAPQKSTTPQLSKNTYGSDEDQDDNNNKSSTVDNGNSGWNTGGGWSDDDDAWDDFSVSAKAPSKLEQTQNRKKSVGKKD